MKMIIKFIPYIILTILLGCQSTGPKKYSSLDSGKHGECNFEKISGPSYKLKEESKPYVTLFFFLDPNKEKYRQKDKSSYVDLVSSDFKVVGTGLETLEGRKLKNRYIQEEFNGELYKRDISLSTKVVTDNCSIFYFSGEIRKGTMLSSFLKSGGINLTDDDGLIIYGSKPLSKFQMEAKVKYDKFIKQYSIKTPPHKNKIIRGSVSASTNEVVFVQLYAELTFLEKWGFIKNAVDTDGVPHEVKRISSDADCSDRILGCVVTETIGITLDRKFLESKKEGFEIKVIGTKEAVLRIPGKMVISFLDGIDKAVNKSRSGIN